jgi:hypothetical protein
MGAMIAEKPKTWMVTVYLFMVSIFLYWKPAIAFTPDGRIRPFGTRRKEYTVFPVWWWMFMFAVLSYLVVTYKVNYSL